MADPRLARPLFRSRTNVDALTVACLEHAEQLGTHAFDITKGSYQPSDGDNPSSHTHDLGGAVDLAWCGHDGCVGNLRRAGMAAWHRTPDQGPWPHHVHAVVVEHPLLHQEAANQVSAYLDGFNGLGHLGRGGPDDGPQLNPIPRPVWPWPPQEEDMPLNDHDFDKLTRLLDERIRAATPRIVEAILDAPVDDDPETSVRRALRRAAALP